MKVEKALAGCLVAAAVVALLAIIRALNVILNIMPDSIKLATVSLQRCMRGCMRVWGCGEGAPPRTA